MKNGRPKARGFHLPLLPFTFLLLPYCDSYAANVSAHIEGAKRYGVLACASYGQVKRVTFARAVCYAVVWENTTPHPAINAYVRALDHAGRIFDIEDHVRMVARRLRFSDSSYDGRCVVYVNRFTHTFAHKCLSARIIRRVRGDDFENISAIGERCAIHRVEIFAQLVLQQSESALVQRAVVNSV